MEIRQLEGFVLLAETLSFSKAAELLYISQSTLSKQIAALETELDIDLFIRDTHSVQLTETGKDFLKSAQQIVNSVNTTLLHFQNMKDSGIQSVLRIGMERRLDTSEQVVTLLLNTLPILQKKYPNLRLVFNCMDENELDLALKEESIDLAIRLYVTDSTSFLAGSPIATKTIFSEQSVFVVQREYAEAHHIPSYVTADNVAEVLSYLDVAYVPHVDNTSPSIVSLFSSLQLTPQIKYWNSMTKILLHIAMNDGYSFMPKDIYDSINVDAITAIEFVSDRTATSNIVARWLRTNHDPLLHEYVQMLCHQVNS